MLCTGIKQAEQPQDQIKNAKLSPLAWPQKAPDQTHYTCHKNLASEGRSLMRATVDVTSSKMEGFIPCCMPLCDLAPMFWTL